MPRFDHRLTVTLAIALVVVVLAGGAAAYSWGHAQRRPVGSAEVAGSSEAGGSVGSGAAGDGSRTSVSSAGSATGGSGSAANPDVPVIVELSASAQGVVGASRVKALLSRYFTAINRHDYDAWLTTVSTQQSQRKRSDWTRNYSTTRDSDVYVSDITPGDPMTARIQFASHQAIEFAPSQVPSTCVQWDVTYQIVDEGVGLRVGGSATDPALVAC